MIAVVAGLIFAACSDDSSELVPNTPEVAETENGLPMGLSVSAPDFVNATESEGMAREHLSVTRGAITRSWTPPSGYYLYDDFNDDYGNTYVNFASSNLANQSIDAFFTRAKAEEPPSVEPTDPKYPAYAYYPYHGRLRYVSSKSVWQLSIRKVKPELILGGNYYVYGFVPGAAADDATIAMLAGETSYEAGAKLTIKGLRTAGYDACVIIGAREGFDQDHDGDYTDTNENGKYDEGTDIRINRLTAGDFKFNLKTGESAKNYLYLLFDHLCSALSISIKVDGHYDALRTIKLKQLTLQTATETGLMKEKADVEVDLVANTSGINPISSLNYEPTGDGAPVYQSDDGLTLTTSFQSFLSHFLPITGVTKVVINCTYDVYDKKDNLVRQDVKATNTVRLSDIIPYFPGVQRGWKYGVNMTVVPTYLYVLSDPDLDNPEMVVN